MRSAETGTVTSLASHAVRRPQPEIVGEVDGEDVSVRDDGQGDADIHLGITLAPVVEPELCERFDALKFRRQPDRTEGAVQYPSPWS